MTPRDPDRVMIQIQQWWSRSSDDPDPVQRWWSRSVMIQIQQWWWSRSSDDLDPMMPFVLIQIERWSRSRWLEDEDDLKMKMTQRRRWSSWCREEDQSWKLCRKNTFLVKRECWCICNFRMHSSMYLMYCYPMFIPRCFYYVFESYCLTLMFRSGGLLM